MWYEEEDFVEAEERGRGRRRRERLVCRCEEVRGESDRDRERDRHDCGCHDGRDRDDVRGERDRRDDRHKNCICNELKDLDKFRKVDLILKSGKELDDVKFIGFEDHKKCANFIQHHNSHDHLIIVDCKRIEAIKIKSHN